MPQRVLSALVATFISSVAWAKVDPDCFAGRDSFICALNRVDDAKAADRLLAPVLERAGWRRDCYTVTYVAGDNGGPDALLVVVNGPKGGTAPNCSMPSQANKRSAATPDQLRSIGNDFKKAIQSAPKAVRELLLRHTDKLSLGNGYDGEVELPMP